MSAQPRPATLPTRQHVEPLLKALHVHWMQLILKIRVLAVVVIIRARRSLILAQREICTEPDVVTRILQRESGSVAVHAGNQHC